MCEKYWRISFTRPHLAEGVAGGGEEPVAVAVPGAGGDGLVVAAQVRAQAAAAAGVPQLDQGVLGAGGDHGHARVPLRALDVAAVPRHLHLRLLLPECRRIPYLPCPQQPPLSSTFRKNKEIASNTIKLIKENWMISG